jgi:hypothetical protein
MESLKLGSRLTGRKRVITACEKKKEKRVSKRKRAEKRKKEKRKIPELAMSWCIGLID